MGTTRLIEDENGGVQSIGRYDLIAEIASGGMATVYLARLSGVGGFQRSVAIKCLHPHLAKDADFVEMFLDEARLAALIHHPNVVPIQEVGEGSAGYYLVMDYVEGDTFASLLSKAAVEGKEVPREISLRILVDMLQGLNAAHDLKDDHDRYVGLVHRDVSPQNILVGTDGVTRITDFGVARAASRLSATRAGQLKGKLAYMAPEQANGDEDVDRRADVFSSGIVLWEAMALRRLFKASNEAATLQRVLTEPIVSPRTYSESVPEEVAQVCLKALDRDLERRYVSCAEFGDALEKAATQAGCLATSREVGAYVSEQVGPSIDSHRRAIREWLERRGREPSSSRTSVPTAPSGLIPPPPPPSRRSSAPSLASGGLADRSAITQASGGTRASLRPPPPPPSFATPAPLPPGSDPRSSPSGIVPRSPGSAPIVADVFATGYGNPGTLVSALPQLDSPAPEKRSRGLWVAAGIGAVVAVGAIVAFVMDDAGSSQPSVSVAPSPSTVETAGTADTAATASGHGEPAASASETAEAAREREVIDAEELPEAEPDTEVEEPATDNVGRSSVRSGSSKRVRARPQPKSSKKKMKVPDLDNPYK